MLEILQRERCFLGDDFQSALHGHALSNDKRNLHTIGRITQCPNGTLRRHPGQHLIGARLESDGGIAQKNLIYGFEGRGNTLLSKTASDRLANVAGVNHNLDGGWGSTALKVEYFLLGEIIHNSHAVLVPQQPHTGSTDGQHRDHDQGEDAAASLPRRARFTASCPARLGLRHHNGVINGEGVKNTIEVGVFSHCRLSLPLEAGLGPPPGVVLHRVHVAKE